MLQAKGINKSFGNTHALVKADLTMKPGEIRALLGANGSGKSTLAKTLGGLIVKDSGVVLLNDKEINIRNAGDSLADGIALAYQDLSLIDELTIEQNLFMNVPVQKKNGFIDFKRRRAETQKILERFHVCGDTQTYVKDLDDSSKSLLEVAKTLNHKPKYIILDEVTASLHRDQVDLLFDILQQEANEGMSILFISHRLDEVFRICSTVTILRNGQTVFEGQVNGLKESDLVFYMTGEREDIENNSGVPVVKKKREKILEVNNLCYGQYFQHIDMSVYKGEVVGVCGLQGQGQSEFLRALFGYFKPDSGEILLDGKLLNKYSPKAALKYGIGFLSGDRKTEGLFPDRTIFENIVIQKITERKLFSGIQFDNRLTDAKNMVDQLSIKIGKVTDLSSSLSGGNQQKLLIARNLLMSLKVLLLDDPTKGVDIRARDEIHNILKQMSADGLSCIYYSSDYKELVNIADRIVVFYEGRIVHEYDIHTPNLENKVAVSMLGASNGKDTV